MAVRMDDMILYSCTMNIGPGTDLESIAEPLARWCGNTLKKHGPIRWINPQDLLTGESFRSGSAQLRSIGAVGTFPRLLHIVVNHPDNKVPGRLWSTEIGIRQNTIDEPVVVTVILDAEDSLATPSAIPPPSVTRPNFILMLLDRFRGMTSAPGICLKHIQDTSLNALQEQAESFERRYPIIIVSPRSSGDYMVDPEMLRQQVAGVADVWIITPEMDTWDLRDSYPDIATWNGAVRILWPRSHSIPYVPRKVFVESDLRLMSLEDNITRRLLAEVMSPRMHNLNMGRHVTLYEVRREQVARQVRELGKQKAVSQNPKHLLEQQQDLIRRLEDDLTAAESMADEAEARAVDAEERFKEEESCRRASEHDLRIIQAKFDAMKVDRVPSAGFAFAEVRQHLDALVSDKEPSTLEALHIVSSFWPERIRVLSSAWDSATTHGHFPGGRDALRLMWLLATDYWDSKINGEGDITASQIFGRAFAAKESETTASNSKGKKLRTFSFDGQDILMLSHLKIGTRKPRLWRCHFAWDSESQTIIIGWCGDHLDLR